jgi:cysteine desulfurase NifS
VTEEIVCGAVECNMGGGTPVGSRAWREWNVNELTDLAIYDEISGFPVYKALLCEVVKIESATQATKRTAGKRAEACGAHRMQPPATAARPVRCIDLDNNATPGMAASVRDAMAPFLDPSQGNPSSIHSAGRDAREAIETARRQVARLIGARPRRIVFTGGGSEADNLAIKGVAFASRDRGRHVVTSSIEHPAVLQACDFLERAGWRVTYLQVDADGRVLPESLRAAITGETILVSLMAANNEVGTIQPVRELGAIARERGVPFHTDAVQAAGKIPVNVDDWNADLLTLSGHKFHGPKGVGALFVREGMKLEPLVHGGKQEGGLRGGTENVAAIVGMGKAAELAAGTSREGGRIAALRDRLERGVRDLVPGARLNGQREARLPNTLNLTLPALRGESLAIALDRQGISLSSGSACKSGSPEPTHVLLAMGRSDEDAHCSVRFSLSHETTERDIDDTLAALARVLDEMENTIRFLPCK